MKGYHEGRKLNKFFMSFVSLVLAVMLVASSAMTAFAYQPSNAATSLPPLEFSGVDSILSQKICLITFEDLEQDGADSEGRAIVGGNLTINGGWSASVKAKFKNDYALIVNGDVTATGYLAIGGCAAQTAGKSWPEGWTWDSQGSCNHGVGNASNGYDSRCIHVDSSGWIDKYVKSAKAAFIAASETYAASPNDGNISVSGTTATLSPSSSHKSGNPHVFNIDGNAVKSVNFNGTFGSDAILINISGTKPSCYSAPDSSTFLKEQAVWNYFEATELSISSNSVQGSLLAPYATFTGNQGHVNGTTIVNKMIGAGGFEYHTGYFFKNPFSSALAVTKKVVGEAQEDESFSFTLTKANGTLVKNFSLKAGETFRFSDLEENVSYKVTELASSELFTFDKASATGDYDSISGKTVTFTAGDGTSRDIVFTNIAVEKPKTGSITVSKVLSDSFDGALGSFGFTLYQSADNGSTWSAIREFAVNAGSSVTISELSAANKYKVVEDDYSSLYSTANTVGNGKSKNGRETDGFAITPAGDTAVAFTNTRRTANLTVGKVVAGGSADSFKFRLYKESNGKWVADSTVADFNVKAGSTVQIKNLAFGLKYAVAEISSGNYNYSGVEGGSFVTIDGAPAAYLTISGTAAITFTNELKKGGLTITKEVVGGGNASDKFTFIIEKKNGSSWDAYDEFTLTAGASKSYDGLTNGDVYRIYEKSMGSIYEFDSISGDAKAEGQYAIVTVKENSALAVNFKNKVKTASLKITKALVDDSADRDASFTFEVHKLEGKSFKLYDTISISVGNGKSESYTLTGLPYGTTYKVIEKDAVAYKTSNTDGVTTISSKQTDPIVINGDKEVTFTNTRKVTLSIDKTIAAGDTDMGKTFSFVLQRKNGSDWTDYKTFSLKASDEPVSYTVDAGYFRVLEAQSMAEYTFSSYSMTSGATNAEAANATIAGVAYKGVSFKAAADATITIENATKKSGLVVTKVLTDTVTPDRTFTFKLQKRDSDGNFKDVAGQTLELGHSDGATFTGLEYGAEYRVVETVDPAVYTTTVVTSSGSGESTNIASVSDPVVIGDGNSAVLFTNTRKTAILKITKSLKSGSADLGEKFGVTVYKPSGANAGWKALTKAEDGVEGSFTVSAGKSVTLALPIDVTYKVVETDTGKSYVFEGANGLTNSTISLKSDSEVVLTNAIKTGDLKITKTLVDKVDPDAKFAFTVYEKGSSVPVKSGSIGNSEFMTVTGLPYGKTYVVRETVSSNVYDTEVTVGGSTSQATSAEVTISSASAAVAFKNTRKTSKVTVSKLLSSGSNLVEGESFTFRLYSKVAGEWKATSEPDFTLAIGESKDFTLDVGVEYCVVEIKTGASYILDESDSSVTYSSIDGKTGVVFTNDEDGTKVNVYNKNKTAQIVVRKSVIGGDAGKDTFTFELYQKVSGVYIKVGEGKAASGGKVIFDASNVSAEYPLYLGNEYKIVETNIGSRYELTAITGADTFKLAEASAFITLDGSADVSFTNSVRKGKIVVKKSLVDALDGAAEFSFTAENADTGEQIGTYTMGNNGIWPINDIPYGTRVKITESAGSVYETVVTGLDADGTVTIGATPAAVEFKNTRKQADFFIRKTVSGVTEEDEEFTIKVTGIFAGSTSASTKTYVFNRTGKGDSNAVTYAKLDDLVKVEGTLLGGKYTVEEIGAAYYSTYINSVAATSAELVCDGVTIGDVSNVRKTAGFTVRKSVIGNAGTDTFTFKLEKKVGGAWVDQNKNFTLKAGEEETIAGTAVGEEYRVTELGLGARYTLTAIDGADEKNLTAGTASAVVAEAGNTIVFTNTVKTGSVTVRKELVDGYDAAAKFLFTVTDLTGNTKLAEKSLGAGETLTVSDIPYGTKIKVSEAVLGSLYTTAITGDADADGVLTVSAESASVVFKNTRKTATLTVRKSLLDGGSELGKTFSLALYMYKDSKWSIVEPFSLKADESRKFTGLFVGVDYAVVEADATNLFNFAGTSAGTPVTIDGAPGAQLTLEKDTALTVNNERKTAGLRVTKSVIGDAGSDTFTFKLEKSVGGKWVDQKKNFTLSAANKYTWELAKVAAGDTYRITEINIGSRYALTAISGADASDIKAGTAEVTISTSGNAVNFENTVRTGSISVKKDIVDGYDKNAKFDFTIKNTATGEVLASGKLGAGETLTAKDIPYGTRVQISESVLSDLYDTTITGDADANGIYTVSAESASAIFKNVRKTGTLTVEKKLLDGGEGYGKDFSMKLERVEPDGSLTIVENFKLKGGEKRDFGGLYVGVVYVVTETDSTEAFSFVSMTVDGSEPALIGENGTAGPNAQAFSFGGDTNVVVSNRLNKTSLTINKAVVGGTAGSDSFAFTLEKFDGAKWVELDAKIVLSAENGFSFVKDDVVVGEKYRVTEQATGVKYELSAIDGADAKNLTARNAEATIVAEGNTIVFTNKLKTGKIIVTKTLEDTIESTKEFSFRLERYDTALNDWVVDRPFKLAGGGAESFDGLVYGEAYRVVELDESGVYKTSYTIGSNTTTGNAAAVTIANPETTVKFTNTRKQVKLTVDKQLVNGETNESFALKLQKLADGSWVDVESFALKASDPVKTFNLEVNGKYRLTEQVADSSSYEFSEIVAVADASGVKGVEDESVITTDDGIGSEFILTGNADLVVKNKLKTASLTVRKSLSGANTDELFCFELYKKSGDSYTRVDSFELKGGESKTVQNLNFEDEYRVNELKTSRSFELTSITGADTFVIADGTAFVKIDGSENITFTNTVKSGKVVVTKTLIDNTTPGAEFVFDVYVNGSSEVKNSFTLGNGQKETIESGTKYGTINYGDTILIKEQASGNYATTIKVNGNAASAAKVTIAQDTESIEFTNTRKTAVLTVAKALKQGDNKLDDTFTFELYKKVGESWKLLGESFTLKEGATKRFTLDVAAEYKVVETGTGKNYVFDSVSGASRTAGENAGELTLTEDTTVTVINTVKKGSISVNKLVEDNYDKDAKFNFTATDVATGKVLATGALGAGESMTVTDIPYGTKVRISESVLGTLYSTTISGDADENGVVTVSGETASVIFKNTRKTAELIVTKALTDDLGAALNKTFGFELMLKTVGGDWVNVDSFILAAGEEKRLSGLYVGAEYKLIETDTTDSFSFDRFVSETPLTTGIEKGKYYASFTVGSKVEITACNKLNTASIRLNKAVVGDAKGDSFTFGVEKLEGGKWVEQSQTVTLMKDNSYTATLSDLSVGDTYRFTELNLGSRYTLTAIDGADEADLASATAEVTVLPTGNEITFTNTVKKGSVSVRKDVVDAYDKGAKFDFTITNLDTGALLASGKLGSGEVLTAKDIPYGTKVKVSENVLGELYSTAITGDADENGVYTVSADTASIVFKNTRKTASLKVSKKLADGGEEHNKSFAFELYRQELDNSWKLVEKFSLKADESKDFTGLFAGVSYRVLETDSTDLFSFKSASGGDACAVSDDNGVITGQGAELRMTEDGARVEITNELKRASLLVTKQVVGDAKGDSFTFTLEKQVGGKWVDQNKSFTLSEKNDYTWELQKAAAGDKYRITEVGLGSRYTLTAISGADASSLTAGTAEVTIVKTGNHVYFENTVKLGSVSVNKLVEDNYDKNAKFGFTIADAETGEVFASDSLGAGETLTAKDIPYGTKVKISETVLGDIYATTVQGADNGVITVDSETASVIFKNVRKLADVTVKKTLADGGAELDKTFSFVLQQQELDGSWSTVADFKLKGDEIKSIKDLYVGVDYRIVETDSTESFSLSSIYVNGEAAAVSNGAAVFTLNGKTDIEVSNTRNKASLELIKTVIGENPGDSFTFSLERFISGQWVSASEDIVLSEENGYKWKSTDVVVGETYRFTEKNLGTKFELTAVNGADKFDLDAKTATVTIAADGSAVNFQNSVKTGKLIVSKKLVDLVAPGSEFSFDLVKYDAEDEGTVVKSFSLKDGETFDSAAAGMTIYYGDKYAVIEKSTGSIYDTSVTVDGKASDEACSTGIITISKNSNSIVFTNIRKVVDFSIRKTVSGVTEDDEQFTIQVTGIFADSVNGEPYTKTFIFNRTGEGESDSITYAQLDDTVKVPDTLIGAEYKVEEIGATYYTSYINEVAATGATLIADGEIIGDVSNVRKTADLTVTKAITKGKDLGESFTFQLYASINGKWQPEGSSFKLKANESKTIKDLAIGIEYKLLETDSGKSYMFGEPCEGTSLVSTKNEKGVSFVLTEDKNVVMNNIIKTDSITVRKAVTGDGGDSEAEFSFELQMLGEDEKWTTLEKFKLKANEIKTFESLELGQSYKVIETDTGDAYSFNGVEITGNTEDGEIDLDEQSATVVLSGSEDITFTNKASEKKLTVLKKLSDGSPDYSEEFGFTLYKNTNGAWTLVKTFYLTAGESVEFPATYGVQYKVVEFSTGASYVLGDITGADSKSLTDGTAIVMVNGDETLTYRNDIKTGALTISKTTSGLVSNSTAFNFKVTDQTGAPFKNAALDGNGQFTLTAGQTLTINDIPYGTVLTVSELADETKYVATYSLDSNASIFYGAKTTPIEINKPNSSVSYVNTYVESANNAHSGVLGATETNPMIPVNKFPNSTVVTNVLGDDDTIAPDTGDQIPVSVCVVAAVSGLMVLLLSKKRRSLSN